MQTKLRMINFLEFYASELAGVWLGRNSVSAMTQIGDSRLVLSVFAVKCFTAKIAQKGREDRKENTMALVLDPGRPLFLALNL